MSAPVAMSELFAEDSEEQPLAVTARRSLGDIDTSVRVTTPNYDYFYLCTELRRKRMVPVITKIRASSREEFGELVRHAGEEFIYVIKGRVVVHTQFYDPVTLSEGQAIYIDSDMGHGGARRALWPEPGQLRRYSIRNRRGARGSVARA